MSEQMPISETALEVAVGDLVTGVVTRVEPDAVYVDFSYKSEGRIGKSQWSAVTGPALQDMASPGDTVRAVVVSLEEPPKLSRKAAADETIWNSLRVHAEQNALLSVKILTAVKGGLVADVDGIRAFLPSSLVDLRFVGDVSSYVGQTIEVVIAEVDEAEKKLIISRKKALEQEDHVRKSSRIHELQEGIVMAGTVARLTPFGAFVDLGGIDGLLHVSEMAWSRVNKPEDVVAVGDAIQVKILKVDAETGKISLSLKDTQSSPWQTLTSSFHVGDVIAGTVKRLSNFGAFVEVAPGVEGLVHVSQIADRRIDQPSDALTVGQSVQAKILELKPEEQRMSLSIKEAHKAEDKKRANNWVAKQTAEAAPGTTLGDLFGDMLRDKFK